MKNKRNRYNRGKHITIFIGLFSLCLCAALAMNLFIGNYSNSLRIGFVAISLIFFLFLIPSEIGYFRLRSKREIASNETYSIAKTEKTLYWIVRVFPMIYIVAGLILAFNCGL